MNHSEKTVKVILKRRPINEPSWKIGDHIRTTFVDLKPYMMANPTSQRLQNWCFILSLFGQEVLVQFSDPISIAYDPAWSWPRSPTHKTKTDLKTVIKHVFTWPELRPNLHSVDWVSLRPTGWPILTAASKCKTWPREVTKWTVPSPTNSTSTATASLLTVKLLPRVSAINL